MSATLPFLLPPPPSPKVTTASGKRDNPQLLIRNCRSLEPHPTPAPPSRLPLLVLNRKSSLSIHKKLYQTFFLCKKTLKFLSPAGGVGYFWNASSLCLITRVSVKPVTRKRFDSYEHTIHLHIKKLLEPGDGLQLYKSQTKAKLINQLITSKTLQLHSPLFFIWILRGNWREFAYWSSWLFRRFSCCWLGLSFS